MTASLSRSVEDYLKAIYHLAEVGSEPDVVTTSDIAERLAVAPASVTGMVKRLAEAGHLEHTPYHGVRLTETGEKAALAVMRRHRILETYLITKLAYDWASVHEEAERLEHAVSDELVERMAFALGNPQYDPHGAPIPTREGTIERPRYESLAEVEVGARVAMRQVGGGDDDAERLRFLKSLGLVPSADITVMDKQPFGGPIAIRVGGERGGERVIGTELAGCILVERVSA